MHHATTNSRPTAKVGQWGIERANPPTYDSAEGPKARTTYLFEYVFLFSFVFSPSYWFHLYIHSLVVAKEIYIHTNLLFNEIGRKIALKDMPFLHLKHVVQNSASYRPLKLLLKRYNTRNMVYLIFK